VLHNNTENCPGLVQSEATNDNQLDVGEERWNMNFHAYTVRSVPMEKVVLVKAKRALDHTRVRAWDPARPYQG